MAIRKILEHVVTAVDENGQPTAVDEIYRNTLAELVIDESGDTVQEKIDDYDVHLINKSNPHSVTTSQIGAVPTSRTINNKPLTADITLTPTDVGADAAGTASSAVNTHNTANTSHTDIRSDVAEALEIAEEAMAIALEKGRGMPFLTYQEAITYLNSATNDVLQMGDMILVATQNVPDLWVYSVETTSVPYTYTSDEDFIADFDENTLVQVGFYKLAESDSAKVDLSGYVPTSRTINNKPLSANITLNASDVGAVDASNTAVAATPDTVVKRDANGRAQFADPVNAADAATKQYVDDNSGGIPFGTTSGAATALILTLDGFSLYDGAALVAKLHASSGVKYSSYTLNVNGTGAYPLRASNGSNMMLAFAADSRILVIFGGDHWDVIGEASDIKTTFYTEILTTNQSWTMPTNVKDNLVTSRKVGGGGSGGGGGSAGGGGGSGGYQVVSTEEYSPGQSVKVTIGAGATGKASGVAGATGGTTSFGSVTAAGGSGGGAPSGNTGGAGGSGGSNGGYGGSFGSMGTGLKGVNGTDTTGITTEPSKGTGIGGTGGSPANSGYNSASGGGGGAGGYGGIGGTGGNASVSPLYGGSGGYGGGYGAENYGRGGQGGYNSGASGSGASGCVVLYMALYGEEPLYE